MENSTQRYKRFNLSTSRQWVNVKKKYWPRLWHSNKKINFFTKENNGSKGILVAGEKWQLSLKLDNRVSGYYNCKHEILAKVQENFYLYHGAGIHGTELS